MKPLVSVVIPTIPSRSKLLQRAIDSVNKQTYSNIELVVVDEGLPAPVQRNIGIERSNGDFIAFLDDDDIWMVDKLEEQVKLMGKNPDVPLVVCYSRDMRFNQDIIHKPPDIITHEMILKSFNLSSTSSYMARRYPLEQIATEPDLSKIDSKCNNCTKQHICWVDFEVGIWSRKDLICNDIRYILENQYTKKYFDESLPSAQEYDLAIRLSAIHYVMCTPRILCEMYSTPGQISENWGRKISGIMMLYAKHHKIYKKLGLKKQLVQHIKTIGLLGLFTLGYVFGNKIYNIIIPAKKVYEKR